MSEEHDYLFPRNDMNPKCFTDSGTLLSMIISSTNGSVVPFLALKLKLDPAKFAGPLETAFQVIDFPSSMPT